MDREKFIERQNRATDYAFPPCVGKYSARQRFQQLTLDTFDFLLSEGAESVVFFLPSPDSGVNPLRNPGIWRTPDSGQIVMLSPALIERWESWHREYAEIRARNPLLELRDLMHAISESHNASSWPSGYEAQIRDWIDSGDMAGIPFDDRYGIITSEFFNRLRELRELSGGWLYWSDEERSIVFATDADRQQSIERQRAAALDLLDKYRSDATFVLRENEQQQKPE